MTPYRVVICDLQHMLSFQAILKSAEKEICPAGIQASGEYSEYYHPMKQIGQGAFGSVWMSYKKSDKRLVKTLLRT